jgi:hypothetical protein
MSRHFPRALLLAPIAVLLFAAYAVALLIEAVSDLSAGRSHSEKAS